MRFDFERDNYQYVVKQGDSLYKIAKEYGVTVNELLNANGLKNALIYPNQVLIIPLNNNGEIYFVDYVVKENDTIEGNADKYKISIKDLDNYNNLEKIYLASDQVLTVPNKARTHKVVATDTIDYILRKYDMTLEELVNLNEDKLLVINSLLNVK